MERNLWDDHPEELIIRYSNLQEPRVIDSLGTCCAVVMEQIKENDRIKELRSLGLK